MKTIHKILIGLAVAVSLATAGFVATKPTPAAPGQQVVGATSGTDHYSLEQFYNGLASLYFKTTTTGISSSSPASLGTASSGHFVIPASTSTVNASTTAITKSSDMVFFHQELTTPIAGTTCNTSSASGTLLSLVVVSATSTNNGFTLKTQSTATTNPYCFEYLVVKGQ
jgi:hypothetical protein